MSSSEDIAYAVYLADYKHHYNNAGPMRSFATSDLAEPKQWDDLSGDEQEMYLRHGNAAMEHLFEHGRISSYIDTRILEELSKEYSDYLGKNNAPSL